MVDEIQMDSRKGQNVSRDGSKGERWMRLQERAMHHSIIAEVDKGRECVGLEWESTSAIPMANAGGYGGGRPTQAWPKGNGSALGSMLLPGRLLRKSKDIVLSG